jgi:deoxyribonuclease I
VATAGVIGRRGRELVPLASALPCIGVRVPATRIIIVPIFVRARTHVALNGRAVAADVWSCPIVVGENRSGKRNETNSDEHSVLHFGPSPLRAGYAYDAGSSCQEITMLLWGGIPRNHAANIARILGVREFCKFISSSARDLTWGGQMLALRWTAAALLVLAPTLAFADRPSRPFESFGAAKKAARDGIYSGHHIDFYCGCGWTPNQTGTSGKIDATKCHYAPRKNPKRGRVLEWEHVVPAAFFGQSRACWKTGNPKCVRPNGAKFKGRACCEKVDREFARIEADLHNLTPAVGELNADRSNTRYGIVKGEPREYGSCDFEISSSGPKVTEPRDEVRGDAARIWLYMSDTYGIKLSVEQRTMFEAWSQTDPVDSWERLRDVKIEAIQGNRNPYVRP